MTDNPNPVDSRRDFLKQGTAAIVTGALVANSAITSRAYAAGSDVLRVGLVGCGGRGTGAAQDALEADPQTRLVALCDLFDDQIQKSLTTLKGSSVGDRVDVPTERQFTGFDGYKNLLVHVDVVLLCTTPHFRPEQIRAAIEADKHVFAEKPVAVDAAGVKSVMESCELAKAKGLSVVSGLCWRYHNAIRATIDQVHEGAIGDITAMQCSYLTGGLWTKPRQPEWSDMEFQVRNWLYFTWLSGDFINEQHIHSLDKVAWAMKDEPPVSASGVGGRQVRTGEEFGNVYDHFAVVYEYANGVKAFSRCRQQNGCKPDVTDHFFGTKGTCHIASHRTNIEGENKWRYRGEGSNMYQQEHEELFASIRNSDPINNGDYMCKSTMMAILGRMAAYTGQTITWEQAMNSEENFTLDSYEWTSLPEPKVAMPGVTQFV